MPKPKESNTPTLKERYAGCLIGLAVGDAVGTTVEFKPRGSFEPLTDMVGGGPFELEAGQWTDDTSMALCLGESLLTCKGFDPKDQMTRYTRWREQGHLSATGECFDIGNTVRQALDRFAKTQNPCAGSTDLKTAGNRSLMRLAPVVLYYYPDRTLVDRFSADSSRTTHGAPEAVECCRLFASILARSLDGLPKSEVLTDANLSLGEPHVVKLAAGGYMGKRREDIRGSGYSVESLEAALWCFHSTATFESAILEAANLGGDADTTAAIVGQVAGAHYGVAGIPAHWLERLYMHEEIAEMAEGLRRAGAAGTDEANAIRP